MEGIIGRLTQISKSAACTIFHTTETFSDKSKEDKNQNELILLIRETGKEMAAVRSRFDLATDFDMIDSYIMQLDSLEKRYNYLIKEAKRERIAAF